MGKEFRALRLVSLLCKVLAWVIFIGGSLLALFVVVLGAIQGRVGAPSPLLSSIPGLAQVHGPLSGLVIGIVILLVVLVHFILLYATNEVIQLALAIEQNTRETAYYLKGETEVPPPPSAVSWEQAAEEDTEEG